MKDSPEKISPLRRRMIEDMRMRKLSTKTQDMYVRAVRHFAGYLGRSPDSATDEDLRRYQLHCVDRGVSPITLNATITGLKFFFEVTLKRPELLAKMSHVRVARTLPVVLSREEASRLIESARTLKHRTALSVAYGAGLRVSEVVALKVGDIDSQRMLLRIEKGKGQKDRYALLPPILLERLRTWWRYARAEGKVLPGGYLFPGLDPMDSLSTRQLNRAVHEAAQAAHIEKRVGEHVDLYDTAAFADWLTPLRQCEWVVYAKRPFSGPQQVLPYLSRYTHRVAIANSRLVALDDHGVTFRWKDYRAHGRTRYKTMTLRTEEFMRRFLLHVLPSGFHRIRHYGLLANANRKHDIAAARELLHQPAPEPAADPSAHSTASGSAPPSFVCRHCGAPMIIIESFARAQHIRGPPCLSGSP